MTVVPEELAPPAYEASEGGSGSSSSGPPPPSANGSSWPRETKDYFPSGRMDDAVEEEDELLQSVADAAGRRDGYTAISIDPAQTSSARRSYDGEIRDDYPVLERSGSSVIIHADQPWVNNVDELCQYGTWVLCNGMNEIN